MVGKKYCIVKHLQSFLKLLKEYFDGISFFPNFVEQIIQ